MSFSDNIKNTVLLWCDRHCCVCKKPCGINIEVHHIIPKSDSGPDEIDNAIPLCFECHGLVEHYNTKHPKGNKFKKKELKTRRDQVYEEFTRHLIPPVHYQVTQLLPNGNNREFPDVGFVLSHNGDSLPVKVHTKISIIKEDDRQIKFYEKLWNLNPGFQIFDHFQAPDSNINNNSSLRFRVMVVIIDQYTREHAHLPIDFVYVSTGNYWYPAPA